MTQKYKVSVEVFKYPYYGKSVESEKFLSEKICCITTKICKKIIKGIKWSLFCLEVSVSVANGVTPSQAIGLPIIPTTHNPVLIRSIHSNADLSKQAIIAQVIQQMPPEIDFTQEEMNELYHLSVEYKNNSLK